MRQRRLALSSFSLCLFLLLALVAPARAGTGLDYVALGDSYAAGVGAPGLHGLCLRSAQGYPQLWAGSHPVTSFTPATCSGAVTSDVRTFQVWALGRGTDLVTLTIGGNDVGFADAMLTCTLGSDSSCLKAVADGRDQAVTSLPATLDSTYADVRRHAPNAAVYVLGYPRLFDETATCPGGLSLVKRQAINQAADVLAGVLAARAAAAGFTFVDVRTAFAGHGLCGPAPWINPFALSVSSYHPTAAGYHDGYLPALDAVTG